MLPLISIFTFFVFVRTVSLNLFYISEVSSARFCNVPQVNVAHKVNIDIKAFQTCLEVWEQAENIIHCRSV